MVTLARAVTLAELLNICLKMQIGEKREIRIANNPSNFHLGSVMIRVKSLRRQNGPPGQVVYVRCGHDMTLTCIDPLNRDG